jgi:hypothetical protein
VTGRRGRRAGRATRLRAASVTCLLLPLGCALTYDVDDRATELYREVVGAQVNDLSVRFDPSSTGDWVLEARYHQAERWKVQSRVSRRLALGVSDRGITRQVLDGGAASGGSTIHPAILAPFAALFDVTTFFLSVPPVWLAGALAARDGESTGFGSAGRWLPCERAVLGEADNPYAYLAPQLDDAGRSYLAVQALRGSGLEGRMWTVDCRGERETFSIPLSLWQQLAHP